MPTPFERLSFILFREFGLDGRDLTPCTCLFDKIDSLDLHKLLTVFERDLGLRVETGQVLRLQTFNDLLELLTPPANPRVAPPAPLRHTAA